MMISVLACKSASLEVVREMRSNVTSKGDTIQSRRACLKYMLIKVHLDQFILINNAIPSNYQNDKEFMG